jgi:ribosomal protein L11 methylase PrmA
MIVSGILAIDADEIVQSAMKYGFEHLKTLKEQDWVAITFRAL